MHHSSPITSVACASLFALALVSVFAPTVAQADPPPPAMREPGVGDPNSKAPPLDPAKVAAEKLADLVKRGNEACASGDIDDGLPALRAAWAAHEDADLAVSLAACEVKAQEWPSAADHLAFALRNKDDSEQRKALEASFLGVRARVGAVKVTVTVDGADVFVGDRYVGSTPLPGEVYVLPGKARITAKKTSYGELEGTVDVAAQGTATLTIDLAGEGAIATSHRFPPKRSRTPAFVLGAIGLVGAGVGAALYATGAAKGNAADSLLAELQTVKSQPCVAGAAGCQTLKSLRTDHDTFVNAGTGVLVGSGAVLGAAVVYALWATAAPSTTGALRFAPVASPHGGSFLLQGAF